ncbi:MAG: M1 family metallopeptidase, partial [Candidatus Kapabacteria bacterium]|nr:M1 family metallopeptidase [Candidatus Kapabacteria bacterium]MDW7996431.1 M1 family metallopeptidase [Bacteroidota bacterium]
MWCCVLWLVGVATGGAVVQDWQQGVRYHIRAALIPADTLLRVHTRMFYRNNSPDTLRELYVHLYWNIFAPQSYARQLSRERRLERIPELPPVKVDSFVVVASTGERRADFSVDNTIVRLALPRGLPPGDSVEVLSSIVQTVPPEGFRMGRYEEDYFVANWFPSVCVYDRYGWHTEQYLGTGEFYEEIADFEVELTLPGMYAVAHTGVLLNPSEVLPAELVERLRRAQSDTHIVRVADFSAQPLKDTTMRTWRFRADRVRTFAWAAVRRYLWDAQQWDGILVHVLYPKRLEDFYSDEGLRASVHAVRYFSQHFGRYVYSNMFVVVGGTTGGMEYPGIVFIGRGLGGGMMAPWTAGVIIHEIAHNWYPMMLNSNETEFGFQDEGFTTFATTLAFEAMYGRWTAGLRVPPWLRLLIPRSDERTGD